MSKHYGQKHNITACLDNSPCTSNIYLTTTSIHKQTITQTYLDQTLNYSLNQSRLKSLKQIINKEIKNIQIITIRYAFNQDTAYTNYIPIYKLQGNLPKTSAKYQVARSKYVNPCTHIIENIISTKFNKIFKIYFCFTKISFGNLEKLILIIYKITTQ